MYLLMGSFLSDIQSVRPSASHPLGGELITITGAGLSCDMAVDIDGIPCKVIHSSFSEVKCVTGAAPAAMLQCQKMGLIPVFRRVTGLKVRCMWEYLSIVVAI